jgi:cytidylate kinase
MTPPDTISIAGNIGSGKSSVARRLSELTGWPIVSTGRLFRELAARRGLTVLELNQQAETDRSIDDEVDGHLRRLAASGKSAVIDSRMAWHFVPGSYKVYLVVDPRVAVGRVYGAVREDERYASVQEAAEDILARQRVEAERYHDLYGVHVDDWRNYDLVVDTSRAEVGFIADLVVAHLTGMGGQPRPVCQLDPLRLLPSAIPVDHGESDVLRIAVDDDAAVLVSGQDVLERAQADGDLLVRCELAAYGEEEIAGMPTAEFVHRAIEHGDRRT